MEILVPVAIAAIGIGVLIFVLRRPTVARPPSPTAPDKSQSSGAEKPLATIVLRNNKTFKTSSVTFNDTKLSSKDILDLVQGKGLDQVTQNLLKMMPDAATDAAAEARLLYPGATVVLTAAERSSGSGNQSRADYKTTLATDAGSDQVVAWYQDWLTSHGWQAATVQDGASGSPREFVRGSEHFRLTLADPASVRAVLAVPIPDSTKTLFEVEYQNSSAPTQS